MSRSFQQRESDQSERQFSGSKQPEIQKLKDLSEPTIFQLF